MKRISRRGARRCDALAEYVANGFLKDDLTDKAHVGPMLRLYMMHDSIEELAVAAGWSLDEIRRALGRDVMNLRRSERQRSVLSAYLYEQEPSRYCWTCHAVLPRRTGKGRPRRYCKPACRQQEYRRLKRMCTPPKQQRVYKREFDLNIEL